MNTESTADYSVRQANLLDDKDFILGLLRDTTGTPGRTERKFKWFYLQPELKATVTLLLCHQSPANVVGMVTIGHRQMRVDGSTIDVGLLADLHVEATHRSLYPAILLLREAITVGFTRYPLLYGFPNARAQPLLRRAGFGVVAESRRFVRVLHSSEYLPRRLPRIARAAAGRLFDALLWLRYELRSSFFQRTSIELHERTHAGVVPVAEAIGNEITGAHSPEFLSWRFGDQAVQPAKLAVVSTAMTQSGACIFVCEISGDILHIRDTSALAARFSDGARFWRALFAMARKQGYRSVSFSCTADGYQIKQLAASGFAIRDSHPIYALWRGDQSEDRKRARWVLTDADEDE